MLTSRRRLQRGLERAANRDRWRCEVPMLVSNLCHRFLATRGASLTLPTEGQPAKTSGSQFIELKRLNLLRTS